MTKVEKINLAVKKAELYIRRVSKWTAEQKHWNKRAWRDAMNLSALLSVYRFGNEDAKRQAEQYIYSIFGNQPTIKKRRKQAK